MLLATVPTIVIILSIALVFYLCRWYSPSKYHKKKIFENSTIVAGWMAMEVGTRSSFSLLRWRSMVTTVEEKRRKGGWMSFVMGSIEVESVYFNQQNNQRREIVVCCQLISSLTLWYASWICFFFFTKLLFCLLLNWIGRVACFPFKVTSASLFFMTDFPDAYVMSTSAKMRSNNNQLQ